MIRGRRGFALMVLALLASTSRPGSAGGIRDLADVWLVSGPRTLALCGGAATTEPSTWLDASHGLLFGMPELPQLGAGWSRRGSTWSAGLRWERLGRDLYREDTWRFRVGAGGRWRLGLEIARAELRLASEAAAASWLPSLTLAGPRDRPLSVGVRWPLSAAPPWMWDRGVQRWIWCEGTRSPVAWTLAIDRRDDGASSLQFEIMVALSPHLAAGWRVDTASGAIGLNVAVRIGKTLLRSSHLTHPELGITHRWSLGVVR